MFLRPSPRPAGRRRRRKRARPHSAPFAPVQSGPSGSPDGTDRGDDWESGRRHRSRSPLLRQTESAVELARRGSGDTVAAVDGNFHGTRKPHVRRDAIQVGLADLDAAVPPGAAASWPTRSAGSCWTSRRPRSFPRAPSSIRCTRRVVAARDRDRAAAAQFVCGEISDRGREHPISATSTPLARMPSDNAWRARPESRPSRPSAISGRSPPLLRSRSSLPSACPISRTPSVVRDFPTTPRMS